MRFYKLKLTRKQISDVLIALDIAVMDSRSNAAVYERVLQSIMKQRDKQDAELDAKLAQLKEFKP